MLSFGIMFLVFGLAALGSFWYNTSGRPTPSWLYTFSVTSGAIAVVCGVIFSLLRWL
jgi:hypothetical protein